ncbi:ribosome small subunit-dependent GTPase A [Solitalea sp. MAHUQ-68]|uniref:Small ribosomal subunit biogenesis GTPase RsgA n=1 Tax=Solitalea agri TaxID=2953739 RepID=A0A9X2F3Q9_9SPHI|nr:ribosome small subunit-dependent GTPase A [Solitalea agri]MCO4293615.1 ribosome small subunit-dependent GTPase A [Solitalea agri]
MKGKVIKSTGSWYIVLGDDGNYYDCRIKGKFRIKGIKSTNPIAVGDVVDFEMEPGEPTALIAHLHDRENYIIRKSVNLSKQTQVIAANMDQAVLVVTLGAPRTSLGFIDRFLVTSEAYHIPTILVFNKYDIYDDEAKVYLQEIKDLYGQIGYSCYDVSATTGYGIEVIKGLLKDKTTLFSGHSGVGKSSLINAIFPEKQLKTMAISEVHQKGMHTTTFAEMFELPFGGFVIDTPGIRELGVVDIEPEELSGYFPELREFSPQCKFNNCTHVHEPGCAVIKGVEEGHIAPTRYDSYISIFHNFDSRA